MRALAHPQCDWETRFLLIVLILDAQMIEWRETLITYLNLGG